MLRALPHTTRHELHASVVPRITRSSLLRCPSAGVEGALLASGDEDGGGVLPTASYGEGGSSAALKEEVRATGAPATATTAR